MRVPPSRHRIVRRSVALLLTILLPVVGLTACYHWSPYPGGVRALASDTLGTARITTASGGQRRLDHVTIVGDTLRAREHVVARESRVPTVMIPVDSVRQVEVQKGNAGETALVIGGVVLVGLLIAAAASDVGAGFGP